MSGAALSVETIRQVIEEVIAQRHFIAMPPLALEWVHTSQESVAWEVFRGQLVPAHLARASRDFESWNVFGHDETGRSGEPLLSVKLDQQNGELHVVRGLLCYVWEGYDSGGNVYLSREVQRWVRELAGTLRLQDMQAIPQLREMLGRLLFQAVIGASRLPLTSVEAPLPGWSLGRLAYFPVGIGHCLARAELAPKVLEWLIRSASSEKLAETADGFVAQWNDLGKSSRDTVGLVRAMFNEISLSPYTDFVDKTLEFLRLLVAKNHLSIEQHVDFLAWLLRQLARHLTAYDLVTFHHRGANYPDALLLDAAIKEYLRLLEEHPGLFSGEDQPARRRRRALSLGWLHRRRYEGHPVPDEPTSPGENMRILPPPHVRVPEEQILNLGKRKKRLYADDPLPSKLGPHGRDVLRQGGRDLQNEIELRELGLAIFVERPLDHSPLLAHEAFSKTLAERALTELAREPLLALSSDEAACCFALLAKTPLAGMSASSLPARAGSVVSLADAAKAAKDFVILRTLPGSVRTFCARPDVAAQLTENGVHINDVGSCVIVGNTTATGKPGVLVRDVNGTQEVQLNADDSAK